MSYSLIYLDPPWSYRDSANAGKRGAVHKYPTMTLGALKGLAVPSLAAPDALLAMWWVPPMPAEALALVNAWGFRLVTMKGFTWHKLTKHGADHFGMGNWTRANSEDCLFAVRGKPKRASASVRQMITARRPDLHSAKPEEARRRLEILCGDVPRVELFARSSAPGWDCIGHGIDGLDIADAIDNLSPNKIRALCQGAPLFPSP